MNSKTIAPTIDAVAHLALVLLRIKPPPVNSALEPDVAETAGHDSSGAQRADSIGASTGDADTEADSHTSRLHRSAAETDMDGCNLELAIKVVQHTSLQGASV